MNDASNDSGQPLLAHLLELRNRLLKAMAAIFVVVLGLFYFSRKLDTLVAKPLMQAMPEGTSMIAMPFILHQAWAFVAPGLYRHEKRLAVPLLGSSVLLFYAGAAFAYFVVFPLMFQFFTAIAPEGVAVTTDISSYLDFVLALFLAFGLAFELPIAVVLLVSTGATTVEKLAAARAYVVVGCFVVGMLLTPPDIISQTLLALPMWFLFEIGLLAARLIRREKQKQQDAPDA